LLKAEMCIESSIFLLISFVHGSAPITPIRSLRESLMEGCASRASIMRMAKDGMQWKIETWKSLMISSCLSGFADPNGMTVRPSLSAPWIVPRPPVKNPWDVVLRNMSPCLAPTQENALAIWSDHRSRSPLV
jgi:hypothetical protein